MWSTPIRELNLTIPGSALEAILARFQQELAAKSITRVRPCFYLSTEWGVPFGTIAIAIPFYLARPDLIALHAQQNGFVEGRDSEDILRYLRHEMGHVINYSYKLYDHPDWIARFGDINLPYEEEYRPKPFSRQFVHHLPGFYAQKHPDEDWAETFAVWMTPGSDWRVEYANWSGARGKLEYCDRIMAQLANQDPLVTDDELDEDVRELSYSLEHFYRGDTAEGTPWTIDFDHYLRSIFPQAVGDGEQLMPAAALIRKVEVDLAVNIFRWTGHFPERTRMLTQHFAQRADSLNLVIRPDEEQSSIVALATLLTTLSMNYIQQGSYLP